MFKLIIGSILVCTLTSCKTKSLPDSGRDFRYVRGKHESKIHPDFNYVRGKYRKDK